MTIKATMVPVKGYVVKVGTKTLNMTVTSEWNGMLELTSLEGHKMIVDNGRPTGGTFQEFFGTFLPDSDKPQDVFVIKASVELIEPDAA